MSDLSESLTVAHLSWATWGICSRSLFWYEQPERFTHSCSIVFAFFSVLCKRMLRSLHSFPFFTKERCVLCVLFRSLEKNRKERNVLLGISRQKLEKRTEKNRMFLFKNGKEPNVPNGKERSAQPWQSLIWFERSEQMSEWVISKWANSQPWFLGHYIYIIFISQ